MAVSSVLAPYIIYGNDRKLINRNFSLQLYAQTGVAFFVLLAAFFGTFLVLSNIITVGNTDITNISIIKYKMHCP